MTAPAAASTRADGSRVYIVEGIEAPCPSANEILKTMHKEGLQIWKRMGIAVEIAKDESLQKLALDGQAYAAVKRAEKAMSTEAVDLGTAVHRVIEHWLKGEMDELDDFLGTFGHKDFDSGYVEAHLDRFIEAKEAHQIRITYVEQSVAHARLGYAGTADAIGEVEDPGHQCSDLHLFDWKSGKLYPEVGIQMSAYAHATHRVRHDEETDTNVLDGEMTGVCWEIGYAGSVHADSCRIIPVNLIDAWGAFVAARDLEQWEQAKGYVLGDALRPSASLLPW
jgi:hypothetical protein